MKRNILVVHEQDGKDLVELLKPEYKIIVVNKAIDTISQYLGIDCEKLEIEGIVFQAEKYDATAPFGTQDNSVLSCGVAAMELRGDGFTGPIVIRYDIADKQDESIQRYLNGRVQSEAHLIDSDEDNQKTIDYIKSKLM